MSEEIPDGREDPLSMKERVVVFSGVVILAALIGVILGAMGPRGSGYAFAAIATAIAVEASWRRPEIALRFMYGDDWREEFATKEEATEDGEASADA